MITKIEVQKLYVQFGLSLSDKEVNEITSGANENGQINRHGLNAVQWVVRWIKEELHENQDNSSFSEALEYDFSQN
jgi:hypothetical protein